MNPWNVSALLAENGEGSVSLIDLFKNSEPMNFVENLSYMGIGMLGIFIVMGTLIIGTAILNKVTNRKKKD